MLRVPVPGMPAPTATADAAPAAGERDEPVNPYGGGRVPLQHRVYTEQAERIALVADTLTARGWKGVSRAEVTQMLLHPVMTADDEELERRWREWLRVQTAPPAPRNGDAS